VSALYNAFSRSKKPGKITAREVSMSFQVQAAPPRSASGPEPPA